MGPAGETWNCPHCGERILRSAGSCPACQRRLRFDAASASRSAAATSCPLSVEGTIRHPSAEAPWEYSVVVHVRDSQGEILARRVVGVGAIRPGDTRTFTLHVEMRASEEAPPAAESSRPPSFEGRGQDPPVPPTQPGVTTTDTLSPAKPSGRPD
jgi:hypothetical protein